VQTERTGTFAFAEVCWRKKGEAPAAAAQDILRSRGTRKLAGPSFFQIKGDPQACGPLLFSGSACLQACGRVPIGKIMGKRACDPMVFHCASDHSRTNPKPRACLPGAPTNTVKEELWLPTLYDPTVIAPARVMLMLHTFVQVLVSRKTVLSDQVFVDGFRPCEDLSSMNLPHFGCTLVWIATFHFILEKGPCGARHRALRLVTFI